MTKQEAIQLSESQFWEEMKPRDIAVFQLSEPLLCMPFSVFHKAAEDALERPVFTHEFAQPGRLLSELLGEVDPPTLTEIIELIPAEKRILVVT